MVDGQVRDLERLGQIPDTIYSVFVILRRWSAYGSMQRPPSPAVPSSFSLPLMKDVATAMDMASGSSPWPKVVG